MEELTTAPPLGNVMGAIIKEHQELLELRDRCQRQMIDVGKWKKRAKDAELKLSVCEKDLKKAQRGSLLTEVDEDALFNAGAEITFKRRMLGGRVIKIRSRGREASSERGEECESILKEAVRKARGWLSR